MAWGSDTAATQLTGITPEQFFNQVPTLNPRETAHVQVSVDFPGSPTDLLPWSEGCAFAPRCPNRVEPCTERPPDLESADSRELRCYNPLVAAEEVPA